MFVPEARTVGVRGYQPMGRHGGDWSHPSRSSRQTRCSGTLRRCAPRRRAWRGETARTRSCRTPWPRSAPPAGPACSRGRLAARRRRSRPRCARRTRCATRRTPSAATPATRHHGPRARATRVRPQAPAQWSTHLENALVYEIRHRARHVLRVLARVGVRHTGPLPGLHDVAQLSLGAVPEGEHVGVPARRLQRLYHNGRVPGSAAHVEHAPAAKQHHLPRRRLHRDVAPHEEQAGLPLQLVVLPGPLHPPGQTRPLVEVQQVEAWQGRRGARVKRAGPTRPLPATSAADPPRRS